MLNLWTAVCATLYLNLTFLTVQSSCQVSKHQGGESQNIHFVTWGWYFSLTVVKSIFFIQSMSALHGQMEKGFIGQAVVTVNRAGSNIMCQIAAQKVLHREGQFSFSKSSLRWCLADWHSCLSEHPQFMHISVLDRIYIIISSSKPHRILPSFVFLNICFIYLFI